MVFSFIISKRYSANGAMTTLLCERCNDDTWFQELQMQKENIWWEALRSNLEAKRTHYPTKKRIATWFRFSGCFVQFKWMQTDLNKSIVACKTHKSLWIKSVTKTRGRKSPLVLTRLAMLTMLFKRISLFNQNRIELSRFWCAQKNIPQNLK